MTSPLQSNKEIWLYVLEDYLEMECLISGPERKRIIEVLSREGLEAERIERIHGIEAGGKWISLRENIPQEVWVYDPAGGLIRKFRLEPKPD
jgi:hypothetical protein